MKLAFLDRAYESIRPRFSCIRPRLPGVFLVSVVYGVPVYALTWYSGLIDDLSTRILLSVLVAMIPVAELLSAPRSWKSRRDLLLFALFILPVSLFAMGHKFNLRVLSSNAAILVAVLPYCWLVWLLMGRSWLLSTGLILALALMMIYWLAALSGVGGALEILILPLPVVLFGGIFWAPIAQWTLAIAERRKDCPLSGPGTQALAMANLFFPVILVAVVVPWMLELSPIWSAVSLTIVGVLLSSVVAEPLRRFLLEWGNLVPDSHDSQDESQCTSAEEDRTNEGITDLP